MPSKITTHQITKDPLLIWIVVDDKLARVFETNLSNNKFDNKVFCLDDLPENLEQLRGFAYKVVFALTPKQYSERSGQILSLVERFEQTPVSLVMFLLSELVGSTIPRFWADQYRVQNKVLSQVLGDLPETQLLLVGEAVLPHQPELLPSSLLLSLINLPKLSFYLAPALPHPLTPQHFLTSILEVLSQPHSSSSHFFHSKQTLDKQQRELGRVYEQIYDVDVKSIKIDGLKTTRPAFITKEHSVVSSKEQRSEFTTSLAQNMPSPAQNQLALSWVQADSAPSPTPLTKQSSKSAPKQASKQGVGPKGLEPNNGQLGQLAGDISGLFRTQRVQQKKTSITDLTHQEVVFRHKRKSRKGLFYGGLGFIGAGLGLMFLLLVFWLSERSVSKLFVELVDSFVEEEQVSRSSWQKLEKRAGFLSWQASSYSNIIDSPSFDQSLQLLSIVNRWGEVLSLNQKATEVGQKLVVSALGSSDEGVVLLADNSLATVRQAHEEISRLQLDLGGVVLLSNDATDKLLGWLEQKRQYYNLRQQTIPIFRSLAQLPGKQQWLVLMQNDQELRPTGGFIQAVALLSLENGKLLSHSQYSSYQVDQNLQGRVLPPEEISKYLGEDNWYFRDSNWDPDFPSTAKKSAWFVEKSLNTQVDGVLALTPSSLENILAVLGPVDLPDFNEVVTDKNVRERLEFHSSVQLADSTNKPDYSTLLLGEVLSALQNLPGDKATLLVEGFLQGLETQELLIYPMDRSIYKSLSGLGWTGEIYSPTCPSQFVATNCRIDTLMQVESNVGVNKANAYLEKNIDHQVVLDGETAFHTRTVTLANNARTAAWPKGPYKVYMRLYLPESAKLDSVVVANKQLSAQEVREYGEHQKKVVGFFLTVDVTGEKEFVLKYHVPQAVGKNSSYLFFDQKQPGRGELGYQLTISYPKELTAQLVAPQAELGQSKVIFKPNTTKSSFSGVGF